MGNRLFLIMIILTVQTVKGTCVEKDGKVLVTTLRTLRDGILRVTASCAARTNKATHTVGRQGIVVKREVPLMGPTPFQFPAFHASKPTKSPPAFRYLTTVYAQGAGDAFI
jgi:hypothetical protein